MVFVVKSQALFMREMKGGSVGCSLLSWEQDFYSAVVRCKEPAAHDNPEMVDMTFMSPNGFAEAECFEDVTQDGQWESVISLLLSGGSSFVLLWRSHTLLWFCVQRAPNRAVKRPWAALQTDEVDGPQEMKPLLSLSNRGCKSG